MGNGSFEDNVCCISVSVRCHGYCTDSLRSYEPIRVTEREGEGERERKRLEIRERKRIIVQRERDRVMWSENKAPLVKALRSFCCNLYACLGVSFSVFRGN